MANISALYGRYAPCSMLGNGSAAAGCARRARRAASASASTYVAAAGRACRAASASPSAYVRAHSSPLPPPQPQPIRRSGNYQPSSWDYKLIRSLKGGYLSETQITHIEKLKENVKELMYKGAEPVARLKLVDALQHLGIAYHFEEEITKVLGSISIDHAKVVFGEDISLMALLFRLFRENGFSVSQGKKITGEREEVSLCRKEGIQEFCSVQSLDLSRANKREKLGFFLSGSDP